LSSAITDAEEVPMYAKLPREIHRKLSLQDIATLMAL
jgi:hypothetical protein